jgi:hypothetical protein
MATKLIVTRVNDPDGSRHLLEVLGTSTDDKQLRAHLQSLPVGEYSILNVAREKVAVEAVPARVRLDFGSPSRTRVRKPKAPKAPKSK